MATLEVHNGEGRVERFVLTREQPLMFGSSPRADIILVGEGIHPFHGRVRWQVKKERYKIDASPEAEYLVVNGHKMASASFRQGDEIQVGTSRIFMINEGDMHVPAPQKPARDDVTRVQSPSVLAPPAAGTLIKRGSARQAQEASLKGRGAEFSEVPEVLDDPDGWRKAKKARAEKSREAADSTTPPPARGWSRFLYLFSTRASRPGEEEVLSSPLVFGLIATFVMLVLVGFALYGVIQRTTSNRLFNRALESLQDGDFRNAIRRFDEFLVANPKDDRSGAAKVHRAVANVRQYTAAAGPSWTLALEAEKEMLDSVGAEPAFKDSSNELEELVIKTGEGLAERARTLADPKSLADAESAVALHKQIAGEAAGALLSRSRLPTKLETARAAVLKAKVRAGSLAEMDTALKALSSSGVYAARDRLVGSYPDQANDRDLLARMNKANDLIRKAVTVDASERPAETEPRVEPLGPATSLVLRDADTPASPSPTLVYTLADGFIYALDGLTGNPIWQRAVGLSSPYPPQPIPGGTTVLAIDARHRELIRLDAKTGTLVWRLGLEELVVDPPLVLANQVLQPLPSGKLLVIDLPTGSLRATMNLGRSLSGTPVADEAGLALYLTGLSDVLFVLTRDPLACVSVDYLGHESGSIGCSPARVGRYLIVPENHELTESRWRIFLIAEDGLKLTPIQQVPVLGWTWGTPATSGSVVWATGDRGGAVAYSVGAYTEKAPFRAIARMNPDASPSGPAYSLARSERELWLASGRSGRYELDLEGSKIKASWTLASAGPAVFPPQIAGKLLVLSQQNVDGPGVGLWGIEPESGAIKWRTVLGAPWPSPPSAESSGEGLVALGIDGRAMKLSREQLSKGGFVTEVLPRPGGFKIPTSALARLEGKGWSAVVPAIGSTTILVMATDAKEFKEIGLPCPIGAKPLAWSGGLFVPGDDGRAYLIDPLTGESRAEPFVPPFDKSRQSRWRTPTALGPDALALADTSGKLRRINFVTDPRPRLVVAAETSLGGDPAADPVATKSAVIVVTSDNRVRSLAARDLSATGAWPLAAPLSAPPALAGSRVFIADTSGNVLVLGDDGQRICSSSLIGKGDAVAIVGAPVVRGDEVWLLSRDGTLHARSLTDGKPLSVSSLGVLPAGSPLLLGTDLALPTGTGTLRLLTIDSRGNLPNAP